ncbi:YfcC family protein [Pseudoalteromonas sp. DL-6]|uniref:YfcC family protein n=1 Tax=Pseudoalteromonas sp. DL-6 TaxID=1390185 RepID=UPI00103B73B4|nr:YfcC family protein [Pseudoalteromonas sp. DL-6]QBJ63640.1 C4-dicarboxylate ABC transporter [Pseudoalteromonas sp. DL-6]
MKSTPQKTVELNSPSSLGGGSHPLVILLFILLLAGSLTYLFESGSYQREDGLVIPGSYQTIPKDNSLMQLFESVDDNPAGTASPVGLVDLLLAVPEGLQKSGSLIFMVLVIGGLFGILSKSGAVDAGLERLLSAVSGNVYWLVSCLMLIFALGSTLLGLASEYLLIIPLMVELARRLGMSNLIGLGVVTVAVKVGYLSSITNPLPLTIAQPLLGLPIFSGAGLRAVFFTIYLLVGIAFMLWVIKGVGFTKGVDLALETKPLSTRHLLMLITLLIGMGGLVYASNHWQWEKQQLTAYYIALSLLLAIQSGLGANEAAEAFVSGMKKILMASFLIGVAFAIAIILQKGKVLDFVVHSLVSFIGEDNRYIAALGMFGTQLVLDVLIPSTSGQVAVTMPIMGPVSQLSGVAPQTTVLAFLFGNGITNMITPTSGTLLAYLAIAQVGWSKWAKFILPLVVIFILLACVMLMIAVYIGY